MIGFANLKAGTYTRITGYYTGECLLNGDNIKKLVVYNTTDSKITYTVNPQNRNYSADTLITAEPTTDILEDIVNATETYSNIALPIYEDWDTSQSTVSTYVNVADISFAIPDPSATTTRSIVWHTVGGNKLEKLLVGLSLYGIVLLANPLATTTTTPA